MFRIAMWVFILKINMFIYGKCPKTLKVADKMAYTNSADPDETAPTLFAIPLRNKCTKCKPKKVYNKVIKIQGHLP